MKSCASLTAMGLALGCVGMSPTVQAQDYLPPVPQVSPYQSESYGTTSAAPYQASPYVTGGYGYGNYGAATGSGTLGAGPVAGVGPHWAPGGYEARMGSPYLYHDPNGGQFVVTGNPYYDHYGPGFHRSQLHGHYRFPYYNYRAPWYYPGRAVYNRDTNLHW